jgi:hypothetical protein
LPACASMLRSAPAGSPVRSRNLEAAFHSPAVTFPLPVGQGGVKAPALPLRFPDAVPMNPVHPDLPPRQFSRTSGEFCDQNPLPTGPTPLPPAQLARRSPSGFCPSGSKRPAKLAGWETYLRKRPISLRSPPADLFISKPADHRSESATFPLARRSVNLLEPHSICYSSISQSTEKYVFRAVFLSLYFPCNQYYTDSHLCNPCA